MSFAGLVKIPISQPKHLLRPEMDPLGPVGWFVFFGNEPEVDPGDHQWKLQYGEPAPLSLPIEAAR